MNLSTVRPEQGTELVEGPVSKGRVIDVRVLDARMSEYLPAYATPGSAGSPAPIAPTSRRAPRSFPQDVRDGVAKTRRDLLNGGRAGCGCSSMVEQKPSKLTTRVRFPSPAPASERSGSGPEHHDERQQRISLL